MQIRAKVNSNFGKYVSRLQREMERAVRAVASEAQSKAQELVPVDTGALKASIYVDYNTRSGRGQAFNAAMRRLETAKRQYIAANRTGGAPGPRVAGRRRRIPHTVPEQMNQGAFGSGIGYRYGFGMPYAPTGPYRAIVVAGMYYAPHVEYPTRGRPGSFFMRRAALHARREAAGIVTDAIRRTLR